MFCPRAVGFRFDRKIISRLGFVAPGAKHTKIGLAMLAAVDQSDAVIAVPFISRIKLALAGRAQPFASFKDAQPHARRYCAVRCPANPFGEGAATHAQPRAAPPLFNIRRGLSRFRWIWFALNLRA